MNASVVTDDLSARLAVASTLLREAGVIAQRLFRTKSLGAWEKTPRDIITVADVQVDAFIRSGLMKAFPSDAILSEEAGGCRRKRHLGS